MDGISGQIRNMARSHHLSKSFVTLIVEKACITCSVLILTILDLAVTLIYFSAQVGGKDHHGPLVLIATS